MKNNYIYKDTVHMLMLNFLIKLNSGPVNQGEKEERERVILETKWVVFFFLK